MTFIEINLHTGEARRHTTESLRARMSAIGFSAKDIDEVVQQMRPRYATHATFRHWRLGDPSPQYALESGAWGKIETPTVIPTCPLCKKVKCICLCAFCKKPLDDCRCE